MSDVTEAVSLLLIVLKFMILYILKIFKDFSLFSALFFSSTCNLILSLRGLIKIFIF